MAAPSEEFDAYLAPDEDVVASVRGRLADSARRSWGAVAVTDRRLLFLSDGDRFLDVGHDAICTIRGHSRSRWTVAGVGYTLLAVVGVAVAALALLPVVARRPGLPVLGLLLVALGGAAAAEGLRRTSLAVNPEAVDVVTRVVLRRAPVGALTDVRYRYRGAGDALVLAAAVVSLLGLVGLVALTGTLAVVPLVTAALVGLAVADAASRQVRRLDADGRRRRRERAICVDLVDGRRLDLTVDPDEHVDRVLGEVVRAPREERDRVGPRAPSAGPARGRS